MTLSAAENTFHWPTTHALASRAVAREKADFEAQDDLGRDDTGYDAEVNAAVREMVAAHRAYEAGTT